MSHRFPPALRLRVRREFTAVQERGRRIATKYMIMLGQPNRGPADRLGVIASRRFGGAVLRNRAKRRLREIFRRSAPPDAGGRTFDLVVIPRRELLAATFETIQSDFQAAIGRMRSFR